MKIQKFFQIENPDDPSWKDKPFQIYFSSVSKAPAIAMELKRTNKTMRFEGMHQAPPLITTGQALHWTAVVQDYGKRTPKTEKNTTLCCLCTYIYIYK